MANFTDKLALIITANSSSATGELKKFGGELQKTQGGLISSSTALAGFAAAGAVTAVVFKSLVSAGREAAEQDRRTAAAILTTGGAAHISATGVKELAESLSRKTGIDDSAIQANENLLLTFTNVRNEVGKGNDIFTRATRDVLDLATATGEDGKAAVLQLGKAIQDPISGLTKLQRVGVAFTAQQKLQIRALVDSNHVLEAQKIILGEVELEFGGAAAAANDPIKQLSASTHDLEETLGQQLLPSVNKGVGGLQGLVDVSAQVEKQTNKIGLNFGTFSDAVLKSIPGIGVLTAANDVASDATKKVDVGARAAAEAIKTLNDANLTYAGDVASGTATQEQLAADHQAVADAQAHQAAITRALSGAMKDGSDAADVTATATQRLKDATDTLNQDLSQTKTTSDVLAGDRKDLTQATLNAAAVEYQMATATAAATAASDYATGSVITLADAYLTLGQAESQAAAQSLGNLNTAATSGLDATLKVGSAADAYNQSLEDLTDSSTSAGGATKNLTAAYYDQQTKLNAVRDAQQAVGDTQVDLTRANRDEVSALQDAAKAAQDYEDALHGVAAASEKGKSAKENLRVAKDSRSSAILDESDAINALSAARKKYGKNSEEARRAELHEHDTHRALTQATQDLNDAQNELNGTLHGFAKDSPQLVTAANNLRTAQDKVADSVKTVREAADSAHDAVINLGHASDDLQGKLDSVSTAGASKQIKTLRTRIDEAKLSGIGLAQSIGEEITKSGGSVGSALLAEIGTLKSITDSQPLLKGAFDSVLANLNTELAKFLAPHKQAAAHSGPNQFFADGGWVKGPVGSPQKAIVHGGEFVLSRKMLSQGGHGTSQPVYNINIVNPTGNARQIADQVLVALKSGHRVVDYKRVLA